MDKKIEIIGEQTSPLFRMMWVYNIEEPTRRRFNNNICAFHIGKGFILSVAHNLRMESKILESIAEAIFSSEILPHLDQSQIPLFNQWYPLDTSTNKRYLNLANKNDVPTVVNILEKIKFDTRWVTLSQKNICNPYLVIQFKENKFYGEDKLTSYFDTNTYFHEPALNRHTFLIELELVEAYYNEDYALYKIINTEKDIISRLPKIEIDFTVLDDNQQEFYCLQSSPNSEIGRLLNKAQIEGFLDQYEIFGDKIGGNYTFEGLRYLIKGYFRFGSSGAPYVVYDSKSSKFKVNAIQSQACPIQLTIGGKRDGNLQYINAISSPLNIIEDKIKKHITNADNLINKEN